MTEKCNCEICQLSRRLQAERPNWNEATKKLVNELWSRWEAAATELEAWERGMFGPKPEHLKPLENDEGAK